MAVATAERGGRSATTVARWVSIVAHPFVMAGLLVGGAALELATPEEAARSVALVGLLTLFPVAILMLRQVRSGRWANADASDRKDRPVLFVVGAIGLLALAGYSAVTRPEGFLARGAIGTLAMVAVCAVATRWLKVSLHMAFAALAATSLVLVGSPLGWGAAAVLPPLAWSRLRLGRHAGWEVVAGTFAGAAAGWAIHAV